MESCGAPSITGLDKFTSAPPIFRVRNFIYAPDRARKKKNGRAKSESMCTSDRGTTRNDHFCSLLPK